MDPGQGSSKSVPGSSTASGTRLPTLRSMRDLSLGLPAVKVDVKARKTFVPNLNVRRNKKEDKDSKNELPKQREESKRGRGRGRDQRGGRAAPNLVQETGSVFAEGSAASQYRRSGGASGYSDSKGGSNFIPIPKLNLKHDRKVDKAEEEIKLRELYRDDFVDDPHSGPDSSYKPLQLPFHKVETLLKTTIKKEVKREEEDIVVDGVKIKKEPKDGKESPMDIKGAEDFDDPDLIDRTVGEYFKNVVDFRLLFLQLPDVMPGLQPDPEPVSAKSSTPGQSAKSEETSLGEKVIHKRCDLGSLSDGYLGKIQILKSGKARLVVNDLVMELAPSLQLGYREDVVSVELNPSDHTGVMTNLGQIEARLLCSPHWDSMLPDPED